MPSFTLGALNAATDPYPAGIAFTASVRGTFVGAVQFQRRASPDDEWEPIARDQAGTPVQFEGASGAMLGLAVPQEPDAQVRAVMVAYTSGSAIVRLGQ